MIVRCTARMTQLAKLGRLPDVPAGQDDWYVNTLQVQRRRVLVAVHAGTLFPIVATGVTAAQLRELPSTLAPLIRHALIAEELPEHQLGSLDPAFAILARTVSKKVLGHLTQLAFDVDYAVTSDGGWDGFDLDLLNHDLRRALRGRDGNYVVPLDLTAERLVNPANQVLLAQFQAGLVGRSSDELHTLARQVLALGRDLPTTNAAIRTVPTLTLTITLDDAEPPIEREVELPASLTLEQLHRLIQLLFRWQDRHLYRFAAGGAPFETAAQQYLCPYDLDDPDRDGDEGVAASDTRIDKVLHRPGDMLRYVYDYGDSWAINIFLNDSGDGSPVEVKVLRQQGAPPPEDSGGIDEWNLARAENPALNSFTHGRPTIRTSRLT